MKIDCRSGRLLKLMLKSNNVFDAASGFEIILFLNQSIKRCGLRLWVKLGVYVRLRISTANRGHNKMDVQHDWCNMAIFALQKL